MDPTRRRLLQGTAALAGGLVLPRNIASAQSAGSPQHAPTRAPMFGTATGGLQLGLQWVNNFTLAFVLENVSSAPITVLSHVSAGQTHFDWFELRIESATHNAPTRVLHFIETRTRSGRARETIAPGARHAQSFDTRYWGRSVSNRPDPAWHTSPTYLLSAVYDTTSEHEPGIWRGRLESGQSSDYIDLG